MSKACPQHPPGVGIMFSPSLSGSLRWDRLWCERLHVAPHRAGPPFPDCSIMLEASSFKWK